MGKGISHPFPQPPLTDPKRDNLVYSVRIDNPAPWDLEFMTVILTTARLGSNQIPRGIAAPPLTAAGISRLQPHSYPRSAPAFSWFTGFLNAHPAGQNRRGTSSVRQHYARLPALVAPRNTHRSRGYSLTTAS